MLGEFEYVLITTAAGLGENAYGVAIRDEIETAIQRKCSMGALYTTIDRLEEKGLLKTWVGEATPQRGGRGKRMVRVTPHGVRAANWSPSLPLEMALDVVRQPNMRSGASWYN